MTKIAYVNHCVDCPHADMDYDQTCCSGHANCTMLPLVRRTEWKRKHAWWTGRLIPQEGIREDCPLEDFE